MIIKKTPAEIDKMARAGDILVRTMDLVAGKIRPGVTTQDLDSAAENPRVQGLPRLPRLDLRVAERHGRPRHPRALPAVAR